MADAFHFNLTPSLSNLEFGLHDIFMKSLQNPVTWIFLGMYAFILALFVWTAKLWLKQQQKLIDTGVRTQGVIKDIVSHIDSRGRTTQYIVVEFKTRDGQTIVEHSNASFGSLFLYFLKKKGYPVDKGDMVEVVYDPEDPKKFVIYPEFLTQFVRYFLRIVYLFFAVLFLMVVFL